MNMIHPSVDEVDVDVLRLCVLANVIEDTLPDLIGEVGVPVFG
jgi:hypothetical protein